MTHAAATKRAFNAATARSPELDEGATTLPCLVDGEPATVVVTYKNDGDTTYLTPWYVTITRSMVLTTANGKLITGDPDRNPRLLVREALQILSTLVAGHLESHDVTDDVFAEGLRGAVHALGAPPG